MEIKFRAWDKEKRRMVQPEEICRVHFDDGVAWSVYTWEDEAILNCELILFTGLRDKNGKEIYEGDIILEGGHIATVEYSGEYARFEYRTRTGRAGMYLFAGEVIGNIYENPELMEVK